MELESVDLDRCQRGDPRGLAALWRIYGDRVFRVCHNTLRHRHDAEDATQEVIVHAFECIAQFRGDSRLSTWLHRLTVHHCLNRLRSDQRRRSATERESKESTLVEPISPPAAAIAEERRDALRGLLARLDERSRVMIVLREIEGLAYEEIAAALDVPIGTVMSRLSRARQRLLQLLNHFPELTRL